jgi:hypothetical protein
MKSTLFLAMLLPMAACWGGEPAPAFDQDFGGFGVETHLAWFGTLQDRYGCDTVLVKGDAHPPLATGIAVCDAARWVKPETVRAWNDSTGVREEWEYLGDRRGSGPRDKPWVPRPGRCTLELSGPSTQRLHVRQLSC